MNRTEQNDGKRLWRRIGTAHDPKHTTSSFKHGGGGVMLWARMAGGETTNKQHLKVAAVKTWQSI